MHQFPRQFDAPEPDAAARLGSAELAVHLLGSFEVFVGDRRIDANAWRLRKASGLVKLLALADGHRLHREQVLDWLWPDRPPDAAANNLRVTLHAARRLLESPPLVPEVLVLRDDWLTFTPGLPVWVDVDAFETAAGGCSDDPAALHSTLAIYRGDLLPDDLYNNWLTERRASLRETRLALLLRLARLHEQRGEVDFAIETLVQVVSVDPAHEGAHVGLMRLYAQAGHRREALRQYVRLKDALQRELDVDPDPASEQLYEEILSGHAGSPLPSHTVERLVLHVPASRPVPQPGPKTSINLPLQLTSFVGRGREIAQVKQALDQHRLVSLTGPGGSGKTRLALQVASGLADTFPDGVWLVELAALSDPELVPRAVASVLAIRDVPDHATLDALISGLDGRRLLLLLDNCEHLVSACGKLVEALLRACPLLRVMTTSREALGLPGEMVIAAPPLTMPNPRRLPSLEAIAAAEAVRLFIERARLLQPGLSVTEDNAAAIVQICRRLEGLPLAIELAAARVRALSVQQIAARLDDALGLLTSGARTAPARQQTLQASLDWSHGLLHPAEQAVLRRLAVFAGGCTLEAAEEVCAGAGVARVMVLDLLFQLVDKSLLTVEEPAGEVRYRLLEPIRQYAAQRLEDAAETSAAQAQHLNWCQSLAMGADLQLRGPEQSEWLNRLEREHDNMRAALGRAGTGEDDRTRLWLAYSLWRFWHARGYLTEGRAWLEKLLKEGDAAVPAHVESRAYFAHGRLAYAQQDLAAAQLSYEKCLAIARDLQDDDYVAGALIQLGLVALAQGRPGEARQRLEAGIVIRRVYGHPWFIAVALGALGSVALAEHKHQEARVLYEESLGLFRESGDAIQVGHCVTLLAKLAHEEGDDRAARAFYEESFAIWRVLDHRLHMATSLQALGRLASDQGNALEARSLLEQSLAIYYELGIQRGIDDCRQAILHLV